MKKPPKIPVLPPVSCDWTFLDIKTGRAKLRKIVDSHNVPVVIEGTIIDAQASGDDGVSQEFTVQVCAVHFGAPQKRESDNGGTFHKRANEAVNDNTIGGTHSGSGRGTSGAVR